MTLDETLLQKLGDWRPVGEGRHSMTESLPEAGWTIHIAADRTDTIGSILWEASVERLAAPPADANLRGWAEGIASRAAGLMEPLVVHEIDATRKEALLRSKAPTVRHGDRYYFEVRLNDCRQAVVRRYRVGPNPGDHREQVSYPITHDTLSRFVADLAR